MTGEFSHSLTGLFLFCVPASLFIYMVFYLLLRKPLIALMPDMIADRLADEHEWIPKRISAVLIILGSFAVGAATHIAWDAFTHANTFVVKNLEMLRTPVILPGGRQIPTYKVLQHASSALGLIALVIYTFRWMYRTPRKVRRPRQLAGVERVLIVVGILAVGIGGGIVGAMTRPGKTFEHLVFNGVVSGMATMTLATLLFCVYWRFRTSRWMANV